MQTNLRFSCFTSINKILVSCLILCFVIATAICGANETAYPDTPEKVVTEFLHEDYMGSGLSSTTWNNLQRYTTWEDAPGWDRLEIVSGYSIKEISINSESAIVKVDYNVIGTLESGEKLSVFKKAEKVETATFIVNKEEGSWKISEPQNPPHISPAKAMEILKLEIKSNFNSEDKRHHNKIIRYLEKYR